MIDNSFEDFQKTKTEKNQVLPLRTQRPLKRFKLLLEGNYTTDHP